jgi:hypothetical protein
MPCNIPTSYSLLVLVETTNTGRSLAALAQNTNIVLGLWELTMTGVLVYGSAFLRSRIYYKESMPLLDQRAKNPSSTAIHHVKKFDPHTQISLISTFHKRGTIPP